MEIRLNGIKCKQMKMDFFWSFFSEMKNVKRTKIEKNNFHKIFTFLIAFYRLKSTQKTILGQK